MITLVREKLSWWRMDQEKPPSGVDRHVWSANLSPLVDFGQQFIHPTTDKLRKHFVQSTDLLYLSRKISD